MATEHRFQATEKAGEVSALLSRDDDSKNLLILGHGAGAGMRHVFMEDLASALLENQVATLRYQFPYSEAGRRRPDHQNTLLPTVASVVEFAHTLAPDLPTHLGGKSMGGRMASIRMAQEQLPHVQSLVFFGFPLHPADKPSTTRAEHLPDIDVPMLFLQGTRDKLAYMELIEPVVADLDQGTLHVVEGADHGFHVLKRSGRTDEEVMTEIARVSSEWIRHD